MHSFRSRKELAYVRDCPRPDMNTVRLIERARACSDVSRIIRGPCRNTVPRFPAGKRYARLPFRAPDAEFSRDGRRRCRQRWPPFTSVRVEPHVCIVRAERVRRRVDYTRDSREKGHVSRLRVSNCDAEDRSTRGTVHLSSRVIVPFRSRAGETFS